MTTIQHICTEAALLQAMRDQLKQRTMIYQVDAKERAACELDLLLDAFYDLDYAHWSLIR